MCQSNKALFLWSWCTVPCSAAIKMLWDQHCHHHSTIDCYKVPYRVLAGMQRRQNTTACIGEVVVRTVNIVGRRQTGGTVVVNFNTFVFIGRNCTISLITTSMTIMTVRHRQQFITTEINRHFPVYASVAVWLSGNTLASINVVAIRQTQLVPKWVTTRERVNHLCM